MCFAPCHVRMGGVGFMFVDACRGMYAVRDSGSPPLRADGNCCWMQSCKVASAGSLGGGEPENRTRDRKKLGRHFFKNQFLLHKTLHVLKIPSPKNEDA